MARNSKSKTENKTVAEKVKPLLSAKKQTEVDHLQGKHKAEDASQVMYMRSNNPDCGFCQRRVARVQKKDSATKRFLKLNQ